MSYPKQISVADKLQNQSLDALETISEDAWHVIEREWRRTRTELRAHILESYAAHFHDRKWDLLGFKMSGAYHVMSFGLHKIIENFKVITRQIAKDSINELYRQSILRHAWVLDQTTPPSVIIRIPHKNKIMEAAAKQVAYYRGADATRQFEQRWGAWNDGYYSSLMTNLQMNAMNEGSMSDAADEVDATRVNTPSSGLLDALQRVFAFESVYAINHGIGTVADVNEEADVQQIWETRRNATVCDECDDNEGLPEEEIADEIPLHPNCRCYWRIVPKSWADLLRSGSDADYDLAVDMDAHGLVPSAMAIRDPSGNLAGHTVVKFGQWSRQKFHVVSGS